MRLSDLSPQELQEFHERVMAADDEEPLAPDGHGLREYFAAAALPAALANFTGGITPDAIPRAAALAYRIADAMIAERAKTRA